jgi:threonine/homoserine/homoserine lactone efflux protein
MGTRPTTRKTGMDSIINITIGILLIYLGALLALNNVP